MLSLFCSRLQFVIVTVSDQKIKQNNENVMCSWYLPWQTLEVSGIAKKPDEDALYKYSPIKFISLF